jgi:WD40 repeat protein
LVTCSQDKTLKIWNQQLINTMTLVGHRRGVWDAIFHPIEQMLVSAGGDGMLKGWNIVLGECIWSMG